MSRLRCAPGHRNQARVATAPKWLTPFLKLGVYKTIDLRGDELSQLIETFEPLCRRQVCD
jgi:hypothetical protein